MDEPVMEQLVDEAAEREVAPPVAPKEESTDAAVVEAVLFAGDSPLPPAKIAAATGLTPRRIRRAVEELNRRYEKGGHAFRIEEIAGGYQMLTLPEYHEVLRRLLHARKDSRLSQAAMETLAIIAYRQPILRADIESIRGVASGEVLRGLLERQLVRIVGRAEVIGRPMLYGTTRRFLEVFGLSSLEDLPRVEELRSGAASPPTAAESAVFPKDETGSSDSCNEANPMSKKPHDDDFIRDEDLEEEEDDEFLDEDEDLEEEDEEEEFEEEDFEDEEDFDDEDGEEDFDEDEEDFEEDEDDEDFDDEEFDEDDEEEFDEEEEE